MRKHLILSAVLILNLWLAVSVCLESVGADIPAAPDANEPSSEVMISDWESNSLINNLDGESGTWNINPLDEENAYADADIVEVEDAGGITNLALKLTYSVQSDFPAQNGFWTKLMGIDASYYDHLYLDIKGDEAKGFTSRFKLEIKKYRDKERQDLIKGSFEVPVTKDWVTVKIPLNKLTGLLDFQDPQTWKDPAIARRNLDELVIILNDRHVTQKQGVIYLDNIRFVHTGEPGPSAIDFPARKIEKTTEKLEPLAYEKFLIKRLRGFPVNLSVKKEFPKEDQKFLLTIARDTWRFFDEILDKEHALPLDTIQLGKETVDGEGVWVGDYTNVTNIGLYLMAIVSAQDLGFITKEDALSRIRSTINVVENLEHHASGFPYNYYDTSTLERTSYFVSLVDSGWLLAGLYVVKNAYPDELGSQAQRMIERGSLAFFYDPVERQMYHGLYENLGVYSDYHYGVFYTEPRAASYMSIARKEVPEEHWFLGLPRTFPESYAWQTQKPINRFRKTVNGYGFYGGYYEYNGIPYVPSWGGSSFEAFMPPLVMDEKRLAPEGLGLNNYHHALGQIRYAMDELGYPVWGMSPSALPEGGYSEFGAKPFGAKGYRAGVVTPHASVLALEYVPEKVISNLRKLIELYDIYGDYGFYDAVDVKTGLVAKKYLALDQAMILVSINNYLNQGAIRRRFHSDPVIQSAEGLLSSEKFFEVPERKETLKDIIQISAD